MRLTGVDCVTQLIQTKGFRFHLSKTDAVNWWMWKRKLRLIYLYRSQLIDAMRCLMRSLAWCGTVFQMYPSTIPNVGKKLHLNSIIVRLHTNGVRIEVITITSTITINWAQSQARELEVIFLTIWIIKTTLSLVHIYSHITRSIALWVSIRTDKVICFE